MKKLNSYAIALLLVITSTTAQAQNTAIKKTTVFNNFPAKISCATNELNRAFATTLHQNINLSFSDNFSFKGEVISNVQRYDNLQTTVIKSSEFSDMVFVLSKITNKDNSVTYVGHMINRKYTDGFELKKDTQNNYQLVKIETEKILQDCSQQ
jgi:poly-D-alanine transfer protein DltD